MALSEQEKAILEYGKQNGKSLAETKAAIAKYRQENPTKIAPTTTKPVVAPTFKEEVKGDFLEMGQAVDATLQEGAADQARIVERVTQGEITPARGTFQTLGKGLKTGFQALGQAAVGFGKMVLPQSVETRIKETLGADLAKIADPANFDAFIERLKTSDVETDKKVGQVLEDVATKYKTDETFRDDVNAAGGIAEAVSSMFGLPPAAKVSAITMRDLASVARKTVGGIELPDIKAGDAFSLFKRQPSSVDDVVEQAQQNISQQVSQTINLQNQINNQVNVNVPETKIDITSINKQLDTLIEQGKTAEARALAEKVAPQISIKEKWAGIRPDIKNRIQGKSELMREYFDVTHARNSSDRVPGVQEYAASYAQEAVNIMENQLKETGGDIGRVREKLGTVQLQRPQIELVNNTWKQQLDKLNLQEVNGQVVQKPGTQSRLQASGDLKVINDLNSELRILKQNPSLTNVIDFRTNLDGRINFAKSSREASSSVDPLSRAMRTQLAESANTIVGKSGAADVQRYSEFMEALNDVKSFTDRKAGAEYMLKLVLSGRGREARQIIDTVREQTGIDLLDHATMMQISTELIANEAQKNLFRQELTKSGLDTARLLGGDVSGVAATLFEKGLDKVLNPEKIFLEAAQ